MKRIKKYNQIFKKDKLTVDESINIIDEMYQDRMKQAEENNTFYVGELDNIKFTNLEFASVILLREVQRLRRELKNTIPRIRIEHNLEACQNVYVREMRPYKTEYGLNTSYLSKKEKEELINKRNCLLTQIETYKQILGED